MELTEQQKQAILDFWNKTPNDPPSLKDICIAVYGKDVDTRSKEGREVRAFLADRSLRPRLAQDYKFKELVELTPEQKEYIKKHAKTSKSFEMAKALFNPRLSPNSVEARSVAEYVKLVQKDFDKPEDIVTSSYQCPRSINGVILRVNKYILESLNPDKMSAKQKKDMGSLLKYLNTFRFQNQINSYLTEEERSLFESTFIRYTYDKSDLEAEEVDQYIVLCSDIVNSRNIEIHIRKLQTLLDDAADSEDRRIQISLVEAVSAARKELNECSKRQLSLYSNLTEKRSDRLDRLGKENAALINFVELWKEEETRKQILAYNQERKEILAEEIDKLDSMEAIKVRIYGVSKEEVLDG